MKDSEDSFYLSLYRRFRPQKFSDLLGQTHVATALAKAIETNRIGHAYLFSGPRGTGKTSTARILAKALNCENPVGGEPCGNCQSCVQITNGTSFDVHELDAASNNGVDAMRELISRAALGTPGKWKIYIIDEVHMLSSAAANSLLKTLEEPPSYVVFVLATTDPQKVLPTIKSRTQHFEFHLLTTETLTELVKTVAEKAGLTLPEKVIRYVVRRARGSARDALSILELALSSEEIIEEEEISSLFRHIINSDTDGSLVSVNQLIQNGSDPQSIAADLTELFREAFLKLQAPTLLSQATIGFDVSDLSTAKIVRAIELLGNALISMKDVPDPRIVLELTLIKLTKPQLDESPLAIIERLDKLESQLREITQKKPSSTQEITPQPIRSLPKQGSLLERPTLGAISKNLATEKESKEKPFKNSLTKRDELTLAWGDFLINKLTPKARELCSSLTFTDVTDEEIKARILIEPSEEHVRFLANELEKILSEHLNKEIHLTISTPQKTYKSELGTKRVLEKLKEEFPE